MEHPTSPTSPQKLWRLWNTTATSEAFALPRTIKILGGQDEIPLEGWSVGWVKCREQFPRLKTDTYAGLEIHAPNSTGNIKRVCITGAWIYSSNVDDLAVDSSTQHDESYPRFLLKIPFVFVSDKVSLPETHCTERAENTALSKEGAYRLIRAPHALYANCSVAAIYQSQEVCEFSYSNCNNGNRS